jgi:hypothetical protein
MDAQATGHAISMLTLPSTIVNAAPPGMLKSKAQEIRAAITDGATASLCIVSTPEEMPVNEAGDLFRVNRTEIGIPPGFLFMNRVVDPMFEAGEVDLRIDGMDPIVATAIKCAAFRAATAEGQREHIQNVRTGIPMPSVTIPEQWCATLGETELGVAAAIIARECHAG